ncbi:MAG: SDR family NAD(P)-dependent oxidoreductase, partial [Pseudomonadota bacterium]|nr:SDR family NAD(P)-dependent oxidoreductase [Pseudomonadota bacterium]
MRVLVTGANGFIGANIVAALLAAGHRVVCAVRDIKTTALRFPHCEMMAVDFNRDVHTETWLSRLQNIDAVINCAGVLRGTRQQSIQNIHLLTPQALFQACVQAKIASVIQISALGIVDNITEYATSKRAGDEALLALPLNSVVLRPALVVAPG